MTDMMYRLVLRAKFENERELERVIQGLTQLEVQGAKVNISMGKAGREGAVGLNTLATSALRAGFMFNMLESAFMRVTMGQMMMTRGQNAYNKAVKKFGVNSEEARQAAEMLEMQTKYLNLANNRANISMGLMITQLALQSNLLKKATLSQIGHTTATVVATAKTWLHNAALAVKAKLMAITAPWMVPAMIGAGIATGVAVGAITATALQPRKTEINIETNIELAMDLDEAFDEAKRQATYELRR